MNPIMPQLINGEAEYTDLGKDEKTKVVIEAKLGNKTYTIEIKVNLSRMKATEFLTSPDCQQKIQKLVLELDALQSIYKPSTVSLTSQGDKKTLFKSPSKNTQFEGGLVEKSTKWHTRQAEIESDLKELEELRTSEKLNSLPANKKSELETKYRRELTVENVDKLIEELETKKNKRLNKINQTQDIVQYLLSPATNSASSAEFIVTPGSRRENELPQSEKELNKGSQPAPASTNQTTKPTNELPPLEEELNEGSQPAPASTDQTTKPTNELSQSEKELNKGSQPAPASTDQTAKSTNELPSSEKELNKGSQPAPASTKPTTAESHSDTASSVNQSEPEKSIFKEKFKSLVQIPYQMLKGTVKTIYFLAEKLGLYKNKQKEEEIDNSQASASSVNTKDTPSSEPGKSIFKEKFKSLAQIPYQMLKGAEKRIYSLAEKFGLYKNKQKEEETGLFEMTENEEIDQIKRMD